MVKASLPAYADVIGRSIPCTGGICLIPKQQTWIWTGPGLAHGFSRAVQVAAGVQGCAGMGFEGKTQALLKSRGLSLLIIPMVYRYVPGEFRMLGGEFLR